MGKPQYLFISHKLKREGAQLVCTTVARRLHASGEYQITVWGLGGGVLEDELRSEGVDCAVVEPAAHDVVQRIESMKETPDAVVVNTIMLHEVVQNLVSRWKGKVVWTVHESEIDVLTRQIPSLSTSLPCMQQCAAVVFVCEASKKEYVDALVPSVVPSPDPFRVILNGIDLDAIDSVRETTSRSEVRKELGLTDEHVVLITCGTPKPRKGQEGVVQAALKVHSSTTPTAVLVVGMGGGDDSYEAQLQSLKDQAPAECPVILVPRGNAQHVYKHLCASDIYVCNSVIETFPLGILEAQACGLPVVSTNVGGISEQITEGVNGTLVPPDDPDALIRALSRLVPDALHRSKMGTAGRCQVRERFTLDGMVQRWADLLKRL